MGDEQEGLPEGVTRDRLYWKARAAQLTQELQRCKSVQADTITAYDSRITELEAALTAFCDYQQAARHPWPALDQLVRQGRAVLSTSKEET